MERNINRFKEKHSKWHKLKTFPGKLFPKKAPANLMWEWYVISWLCLWIMHWINCWQTFYIFLSLLLFWSNQYFLKFFSNIICAMLILKNFKFRYIFLRCVSYWWSIALYLCVCLYRSPHKYWKDGYIPVFPGVLTAIPVVWVDSAE